MGLIDANEPAVEILEINMVRQVVHQRLQQIPFVRQRLFGLLSRGDVVEDGHEMTQLLAVNPNGKPDPQRAEIIFKAFRLAIVTPPGRRFPAVPGWSGECPE